MRIVACLYLALLFAASYSYGQIDSTSMKMAQFPNKIFSKINNKVSSLDDALTKQTEKYLERLAKKERKIQERLYKLDSNAAKNLFSGTQAKYAVLQYDMNNSSTTSSVALSGEYLPYIDSLKSSLAFAQKNPEILNASPKVQAEIAASVSQFNKLQNNFTNADQVKEYIRQRKQALKDQLTQYMQNSAMKKYLDQYNQQVYYYSEQVREYKETLNDPDKMLQKALVILNKIPAFTDFMKKNSQLSSFFGMPDNYGTAAGLEGLQTKVQVQQILQAQTGAPGGGGMASFQSNLENAHDQLDLLKDKIGQLGGGSADVPMPDFKPNNEKTHPFLKRLEIGTNIQTTKANFYFPTTTDFGLSIGYKMNGKLTLGIGGSYNVGWGQSINHIHITSNGASLRSFVDMKMIKNFYLSGGYELNYQNAFTSFNQISSVADWSKSGLIGITKMVSFTSKIVKKTKLQLLWDFLSYSQIPRTQPIIFRVGYNF